MVSENPPILRGRDIKRYGYDWANLWLIATFPSRHYDIEEYPAVKEYLLSFGMKRLEQTGKSYNVGATTVKARKKTNNKWYETQDSISYWEDFSKPKIIYPETTQGAYFAYDEQGGIMLDKTCFMIISDEAKFLQRILSSKLFEYAYKRIFSSIELGPCGYQYNKHAFIKLPVIYPDAGLRETINNSPLEEIDDIVRNLYKITEDEYVTIY